METSFEIKVTEDIIALHKEGLSPGEIAYKLGVGPQFAYAKLRQAGVKLHPDMGDSVCDSYSGICGRIVNILDDEVAIEPITITETGEEVAGPTIKAKKVNVTTNHIRKHIITLHEQGLSAIEIANKLGTTCNFVYHRLRKAGLKPHPAAPYVPTEDIVALHKEGLSPSEIADKLNISRTAAYTRLTRVGLTPHPAPAPALTEEIITLHKEGLPPGEIADKLNTTWSLVWGRLTRAGLTPHPAPPPPPLVLTDEIIALHKEGLSPSEIAARLNITYSLVWGRLTRAGLTPHPMEVKTEDIIALYEQGLSPGEIAVKLATTYGIVYGRLIRAGLTPHPAPPPLVPTEDIIALHKEGLSPPGIGARLNVSSYLVHARLRRAGLTPNPPSLWEEAKERSHEIVSLHTEGLTPKQIAEKLGLSIGLTYKRLQEQKLVPHPSTQEAMNTLGGLDEIIRLAKEGVSRYEIARRTSSTWPLVAEALEKISVKPVWPACGELASWTLTLLPIIKEIRKAHPNTEPIVTRAEQLEKELTAINDAARTVEQRLPLHGKEAEKERWCVAPISQAINSGLDYIEPLKGCLRQLDVAELPMKIQQAETCITNICDAMSGAVQQVAKPVSIHSSEAEVPLHHSPISLHCERVLESPPKCYDFREVRSYVMCKAWDILEKEKRTSLPVSEAWAGVRKVCARGD